MGNSDLKSSLWQFIDDQSSFRVQSPDKISRLYFPLANESGILSSISPDLHGDIKTSHNSFLTLPVSIEDLHDSKSSRNFWVHIEGKGAWSLTGVSALQNADKFSKEAKEKTSLEAGLLWHKITRENRELGLKAEIINFAPSSSDTLELMMVSLTNLGTTTLHLTPTAAIPIFGRSADNLRDHHHVTTLLHRVIAHPAGVIVKPTMSFDERGHKINDLLYSVLGFGENGELPVGAFSTVPDFIGEGGNFEAPQSVIENWDPPQKDGVSYHGKPAMGGIRFKAFSLGSRKTVRFVLMLGIAKNEQEIDTWIKKFGVYSKCEKALRESKLFWSKKIDVVRFSTGSPLHDHWLRWVCLQPTLRKLFGCSFLPDFDYGRGGRGWSDLWQDCLALLLTSPQEARKLLLNNFNGVRIDGSNATIIGSGFGEFVADRNNITRVWMDHGVWPFLTLSLYIHQTGDLGILLHPAKYFRDRQLSRARQKDPTWNDDQENHLKTKLGTTAEGSVLEHVIVQHLVQFFNVGEHNHIRLENADWNDGLDMAYERGESVAFSSFYAANLARIADLLMECKKRTGLNKISLSKECLILLDRLAGPKVDYNSVRAKTRRLDKYFEAVQPVVSGIKKNVLVDRLVLDLREKSDFMIKHIRQKEWLVTHTGEGLFNGYYDNHGRRVEGDFAHGFRMTLPGQVFPIMSGVATSDQVREIFNTSKKHLRDKDHGGFRLNTDFKEIRLDLGRAFSFAYGEKENGAFFSHMVVMFANALYQRGFVQEGREVLSSLHRMCLRTEKSRIYPGIPEYFNSDGRGLYHYLTGSASWFVMTVLTQVFGVRGHYGDLLLSPKFTQEEFRQTSEISVLTCFADRNIRIIYRNPKKIGFEHYCITKLTINKKEIKNIDLNKKEV